MPKCTALTKKGTPCTKNAKNGELCGIHEKSETKSSTSSSSKKTELLLKCTHNGCTEFTSDIKSLCYVHRPYE